MNIWKVDTKPFGSFFAAIVRRVDRAQPYFLSRKGKPVLFPTEGEAKLAGCEHLIDLWNTEPNFQMAQGPVPGHVLLEEQTFGTVTSRKGKKSTVTRRRERRLAKQRAQAQAAAAPGKVVS